MAVPLTILQEETASAQRQLSGTDTLVVEHITTESGLLSLESEWRSLESRMAQLPFMSFDWLLPWWQHLSRHKSSKRDELFVCTFRSKTGELMGIAPMMITHRPSSGPLQFRQLQFFGADPNITELRGISAPLEHSNAVYSALLDHLERFHGKWNMVKLTGFPSGNTRLEEKINALFAARFWLPDTINPILRLDPTWEAFKSGLPRNIKESLRKCYNAPKRDGFSFVFEVVSQPAAVSAALRTFFELHRARSEMSGTVRHLNCFLSASSQHFLEDVCARFAERGALRIFQLKDKDAVIATRIGFLLGDSLYLYYSGYDPRYQKYSVMTTVVAESIKYAIEQKFQTVNLSTGRDVSKSRWSPTEVKYRNADFSPRSPLDILKHRGYRAITTRVRRGSIGKWYSWMF